ncbi:hypothetical protein K2173_026129 [Erythroxylum novogranatense]|uniref:Uncharacterized protein n=1 Tax=Erythroxylum novogranatense TaxID=1862640 RepID=A0AAV8TXH1_9ROSI|nr:hypothetical protein K2173_026129 [Erythroxylum novogranatense]
MASLDPEGPLAKKGCTRKREADPSQLKTSYMATITKGLIEGDDATQKGWPDVTQAASSESFGVTPESNNDAAGINREDRLRRQEDSRLLRHLTGMGRGCMCKSGVQD